jgi:cytochrome c553
MRKLLLGFVGALALALLGHVALVQTAKTTTGAADFARSTCASCHG